MAPQRRTKSGRFSRYGQYYQYKGGLRHRPRRGRHIGPSGRKLPAWLWYDKKRGAWFATDQEGHSLTARFADEVGQVYTRGGRPTRLGFLLRDARDALRSGRTMGGEIDNADEKFFDLFIHFTRPDWPSTWDNPTFLDHVEEVIRLPYGEEET